MGNNIVLEIVVKIYALESFKRHASMLASVCLWKSFLQKVMSNDNSCI